jgi:hypothetical protein
MNAVNQQERLSIIDRILRDCTPNPSNKVRKRRKIQSVPHSDMGRFAEM